MPCLLRCKDAIQVEEPTSEVERSVFWVLGILAGVNQLDPFWLVAFNRVGLFSRP